MTPLGCFPRRPNGNIRQLLLLSPEAPNRLLDWDSLTPDNSCAAASKLRVNSRFHRSLSLQGPQADVSKSRQFLVLEAGKRA